MQELDGAGANSVRSIGLRIRREKCGVYGGTGTTCVDLATELRIPHRQNGLTIVGVPIGAPAYQKDTVDARADKVVGLIELLRSLTKVPLQSQMLILRSSLNARMRHYQRVLPWDVISPAVQKVEQAALHAAAEMFCLPRTGPDASFPASALKQLAAPIRHGGFGLLTASEEAAHAAYLSGAAVAQLVMAEGPQGFRPFDGPSAPALRQRWANLFPAFKTSCKWPAEAAALRDCDVRDLLPSVQRQVARAQAESRWEAETVNRADPAGKRTASRLRSCAGAPSGGWLLALPHSPTGLGNTAFRNAGRHRLGTGVPEHLAPPPCTCGQGLADRPDHAMVCTQCNKQKTMRHDLVAHAVRRTACRAGCATSMEQSYRHYASNPAAAEAAGLTRADVSILGPDGRVKLVDVVVTHQHMGCKLDACHGHTGKAALLAAQDKIREFRLHGDAEQYDFVPFAMESHGRLGPQAIALLHDLADWASASGRVSKNAFIRSAYREISSALQMGNSAMYTKCSERLLRARGRHFMPGADVPLQDEAVL